MSTGSTGTTYITNDVACMQACLKDLVLYQKVIGDVNTVVKSAIEVINNLQAHGCYLTTVATGAQAVIAANLTALSGITLTQ